jgi:hypothetical protein
MANNSWLPASSKSSDRSKEWFNHIYTPVSSESAHRQRFVAVSRTNLEIANEMLEQAKRLSKARRYTDADIMIDLAKKLIENNANFLDTVGDVLDKKK